MLVFLHLLFQIPAMFTAGTTFRNLLPFELDPKLVPLLLVLSCLAVLYMPVTLALAFACAWPVMVLYRYFGIKLAEVAPFEVPEWLKTLPWPRRTQHIVYAVDPPAEYTEQDDLPAVEESERPNKSFIPPLP